jgi:hypothetical protein
MIYLLIAVVLWLILGFTLQRRLLFPSWIIAQNRQIGVGPGVEVLRLERNGGFVEAFFIPGQGASAKNPAPAVIFAHGNGEIIDDWTGELAGYTSRGISLLLPEYRGYGRSAGWPSQAGITEDFTLFYDVLAQRPEVDAERIVFHGRSLGGAVLAQLALRRRPAAIIFQSTFISVPAISRRYLWPRVLVRDPFDVLPVARDYDGPVLILHGDNDMIVPPAHARQLHAVSPRSRLIFYPVDHNTLPPEEAYWNDIETFLVEAGIIVQ